MRAPEGSEHGTGADLRRLAGTVRAPNPAPVLPPQTGPARPVPTRGPEAALAEDEDVSGGYDEALFGPSDRPDEPITAGAPFGPGRSFVILPYEDERAFARRVANQLESSSDAPSLKPYIEKLRNGG